MNKIIIFLACISMMAFTACTEKSTSSSIIEEQNKVETTLKTESTNNRDNICYANLLPVTEDYFKNGDITILNRDDGEEYVFRIKNYQEGEYETYVEACKDIGFSDVTYEGENDGAKMFYAYSSDGKYYLQVILGKLIEAVDVSCEINTTNHSESE